MRSSSALATLGVESNQSILRKSLGWSVDVQHGLKLREVLKRFQVLTNRKVIFPADLPQRYNRIGKGNLLQADYRIPYRENLTRFICILIDDIDYLYHHVLFSPLAQQILFWHILVDVLIAPNLQFSSLVNMKHVLEDLKMPVILVEYFEALEGHSEAMQRILEGYLIDFGQISDHPLIVNTELILHIAAVVIPFHSQKQRRNEVEMLVPGKKCLDLPIYILSIHHPLLKLHDFFGVVEVAVDAKRTVAVPQRIIMHLREILPQLLTIFTVPHQIQIIYSYTLMMNQPKPKKRNRRKPLQPCKYHEMAQIDIDKLKLQRYYVPIALNAPVNKGKLDKKVVEVEEDYGFYLGNKKWEDMAPGSRGNFSFQSKEYYEYSYERYHDEMIQDQYEL